MAMSSHGAISNDAPEGGSIANVSMKLEVVVIPVSDVDRAKEFYSRLGWRLDADRVAGDNFRLIQFTPPGSGSSIQFGMNLTSAAPGSAQASLLIVSDIIAAHQQLVARGIDASEIFHCATGTGCRFAGVDVRVSGPHPVRLSYGSFCFIHGSGRQRVVAAGSHGTASWARLRRHSLSRETDEAPSSRHFPNVHVALSSFLSG
jgi:catechol 2,3-dioxygenase-like lactoylglutathione lyase family enzyme